MGKPVLAVVVSDEDYLIPLEMKLAFMIGERINLVFISDSESYDAFFSVSRSVDILLIDEQLYSADLKKHNIKKTWILTEDDPEQQNMDLEFGELRIFKYLRLNVLVGIILPDEWKYGDDDDVKSRMIAVMSPAGGSGCTTVSMALARFLAEKKQKVLYLSSRPFQDFQFYCEDKRTLTSNEISKLKTGKMLYEEAKKILVEEAFDFLPEISLAYMNTEMSNNMVLRLADEAAAQKDYNDIIVDIGTDLSPCAIEFLDRVEKVIILVTQDFYSEYKIHMLNRFLNYKDSEKFVVVCNRFDPDEPNAFAETFGQESASKVLIDEYVEKVRQPLDIHTFSTVKGIQRIGMALF